MSEKKDIKIRPVKKARAGWDKAFQLMHERREDALVINDALDMELDHWEGWPRRN